MKLQDVKIIGLSGGYQVAKNIAKILNIRLVDTKVSHFADGEILVVPQETVRHQHVIVVQSIVKPVNESIMELLICIDSLKRASARSITVVMPYYGYCRQERKTAGREPITAKLIARLLETAGVDRLVSVDLHADQIQGFFQIPVDIANFGTNLLSQWYKDKVNSGKTKKQLLRSTVIVAPDFGGVKRVRSVSKLTGCSMAILYKSRPRPNVAEIVNILGNIKNKDCIIVDDIIDMTGTICAAAKTLKEHGAKSVTVMASHGILSDPAKERLTKAFKDGFVKELYLANTIPSVTEFKNKHVRIVDISPFISGIIEVICSNKMSLSKYVEKYDKKNDPFH